MYKRYGVMPYSQLKYCHCAFAQPVILGTSIFVKKKSIKCQSSFKIPVFMDQNELIYLIMNNQTEQI